MTAQWFWTLPTRHLDAKTRTVRAAGVTDLRPGRFGPFDHLTQIARAAEATGFTGLFIPYDPFGEESWVTAIALARETPRLRLLPEFQPGFATAVYTAKLALSFQRFFADRLEWKLALHTDPIVQRSVGDFTDERQRIRRAEEFLAVVDGVWHESPFSFTGEYFEVEAGGFFEGVHQAAGGFTIDRRQRPPVYLEGLSDEDLTLSAARADVHVFDTLDEGELSEAIARLADFAAAEGRRVRVALRLAVLAREFTDEAWRDARRLWQSTAPAGDFDDHRSEGVRWAGFDTLDTSVATGIIGSFDEVADQLHRYERLGVSVFLLEGVKHLEDTYHLGEFVLPKLAISPELELQS